MQKVSAASKSGIGELLARGVEEAIFPGAVLLAAQGGRIVVFEAAGYRILSPQPSPMRKDTVFDLASLTKPLATALSIMMLVGDGKIDLDEPIADLLHEDIPPDKRELTPRLLLSHRGGFPEWEPFYLDLAGIEPARRKTVLRQRLLSEPLIYSPKERSLYSDLGFMLLEWIIERSCGSAFPGFLGTRLYGPLSLRRTFLYQGASLPLLSADQFAATEFCPWRKKTMLGEVHDENAYALGGYSGHAGLFGNAEEVLFLLELLRQHFYNLRDDFLRPEVVKEFFLPQGLVKGSTWALGWDTPSPEGSSCGSYFSPTSVGHLGFTGASVWMDLEKDVTVILLTNRVHLGRGNDKIREFRPRIHDRVMEYLGKA